MATIKKCDRCGQTYPNIMLINKYITYVSSAFSSGVTYDLCESCAIKFSDFMKQPIEEKDDGPSRFDD